VAAPKPTVDTPPLPSGSRAPAARRVRPAGSVQQTPAAGGSRPGDPASTRGGQESGAGGPATAPGNREALERREQRLRRIARALGGCVSALPRFQERVIVLRAGLRGHEPRSRSEVATIVERPVRRVARAERRALRVLRAEDRRAGCEVEVSPTAGLPGSPEFALGGGAPPSVSLTGADAGEAPALVETGGAGSPDAGAVKGATAQQPPVPAIPAPTDEPGGILLPLLLAGAAVAWLMGRELRRRRAH
jgi:hypothetical protein